MPTPYAPEESAHRGWFWPGSAIGSVCYLGAILGSGWLAQTYASETDELSEHTWLVAGAALTAAYVVLTITRAIYLAATAPAKPLPETAETEFSGRRTALGIVGALIVVGIIRKIIKDAERKAQYKRMFENLRRPPVQPRTRTVPNRIRRSTRINGPTDAPNK